MMIRLFIWVSQKHWLTFGVYSLINNDAVIGNSGLLIDEHIDKALCLGKQQRITKKGEVELGRKTKTMEGIKYDEAGKVVLKMILLNYRWALTLNHRLGELLLPLATSLDEPEELLALVKEFNRAEKSLVSEGEKIAERFGLAEIKGSEPKEKALNGKPLYIEVELNNQPADFFFKLATYLDSHLTQPKHLWRTGAILDFYGNEATRAIIEMPNNVLSIRVMGENKENFQQLLLINVRETINSYKRKTISAHSFERVWLDDDTSQMLSSDIIANLTSGTTIVDKLVKQKLKGAVNMTTINISGDAKGNFGGKNNQFAEGDIIHITQVNKQGTELVEQLKQLAGALPENKQNEIKQINQSIEQIEEGIVETDNKKKKSLMRKGLDGVKDLVVIDKGVDLYTEYSPAVMAGAATLTNLLAQIPSM
ncbi:MAG: hypothetical protein L3J51_04475 [Cocleimonas sp.]|nr:hypothetical protein [Cocleimonas sp.]